MLGRQPILAPIPPTVTHLLDVGCGTGIVTDHMGATYPNAQAWGVDLSSLRGNFREQRSNVHYAKMNILDGTKALQTLTGVTTGFDLVYSRMLVAGMNDWHKYLRVARDVLKPGGWVELQDVDFIGYDSDHNPISDNWDWLRRSRSAVAEKGVDLSAGSNAMNYMRDTGFIDIQQ